jgi:uncharacterized OB-fold protein
VILVELAGVPDVRFVGRLRDGEDPAVGQRVTAEFIEHDGRPDLQFAPA